LDLERTLLSLNDFYL